MGKNWTGVELAKARKRCMIIFWWGHEYPGKVKEIYSELRGLVRQGEHDAIEHILSTFDFNYHCLAFSVFADSEGKEYKSFAIGKTKTPIRLKETTLDPLADLCWGEAEQSITDTLVRRTCIFSPCDKTNQSIMRIVKLRRKELMLMDDDIIVIEECEKDSNVHYFEVDYKEQQPKELSSAN